MRQQKNGSGAGIGVDYRGLPVRDPTENVETSIASEKEHAREIRTLENKFYDYAIASISREVTLRAEYTKEARRDDRVTQAAIRQVDITNQNAAATQIDTALKALAKATEDTRKTLADGMENTRKTLADSMAIRDTRVDERIARLESNANLSAGRLSVSDPAMEKLTEAVALLALNQKNTSGRDQGFGLAWQVIVAVAGLLIAAAVYFK